MVVKYYLRCFHSEIVPRYSSFHFTNQYFLLFMFVDRVPKIQETVLLSYHSTMDIRNDSCLGNEIT